MVEPTVPSPRVLVLGTPVLVQSSQAISTPTGTPVIVGVTQARVMAE